ncbi:MAG: hypothetical protein GEV06_14340 [Luteitalea sp.]|nr:hypothetical protein [Luteitalea sp.]
MILKEDSGKPVRSSSLNSRAAPQRGRYSPPDWERRRQTDDNEYDDRSNQGDGIVRFDRSRVGPPHDQDGRAPPFGAQIILNGHEYVACQGRQQEVTFTKEGNCFTAIDTPAAFATIADTLSDPRTIGRLSQVCEAWIYGTCLCFAVDRADQEHSGFCYEYSVYQVEMSRNLLFQRGGHMEQIFQGVIDRTRTRLNVKRLKTIFGMKARPHRDRKGTSPRIEVVVETPQYDLVIFKIHVGKVTLKADTKGERVLRFEAIVHNTKELHCGRALDRFPLIVNRLQQILERFMDTLSGMDAAFVSDDTLDHLPTPSRVGHTRVGGVDLNSPRMRAVLTSVLALAAAPEGFTVTQVAAIVRPRLATSTPTYGARQAAYDLKKLRGKTLLTRPARSHRYRIPTDAIRTIAALVTLRENVLRPILAGVAHTRAPRTCNNRSPIDNHYATIRQTMFTLFQDLGIAAV